ncbi:PAS domain S-box protein [Desulfovibrio inopinatus]|uniref:PAS domain S-box protein n=1 Tax=Desulfovibrio inopinatus TaxID=102109 RepID=UPI0004172C91|nr:PAS domain S-box protein [Desulfovibrio inopinatus]
MQCLMASVIATLSGTCILCVVYLYLYAIEKEHALRVWSLAWGLYSLRFIFLLLNISYGPSIWFSIANQGGALWSGFFLLQGACLFTHRPLPQVWGWLSIFCSVWICIAVPLTLDFRWISLPTFFLLGGLYCLVGFVFLRWKDFHGLEKSILGWAFFAWGLHKMNYPFLQPIDELAPWGYFVGSMLEYIVALTFLLMYFRRTKDLLIRSETRFRRFVENCSDAIFLAEANGRICDVNRMACLSLGYSREELLELAVSDLDVAMPREHWEQLSGQTADDKPFFVEGMHRKKNGSTFPVEIQAMFFVEDETRYCLGFVRDITQRKQADERLRQSEARFRRLVEYSPAVIYRLALTPWVHFEYVSPAIASLLGWTPEELYADPGRVFGIVHKHDRLRLARVLETSFTEVQYLTLRWIRKDTTIIHTEHRIIPVPSENGRLLAVEGIAHDVTEKVEYEQKLIAAKEAAEEATRTKSEFLANMSHEIRTPLNGVMGMLQLIGTTKINDDQRRYLDEARGAGKRLTRLLSDILELSRVESGCVEIVEEEFDLMSLMNSVKEIFSQKTLAQGVELLTAVDENVPERVRGDSGRVLQVLFNLVGNAVKFTEQGRIEVTVTRLLYAKPRRCRLLFTITDTGRGMSEGELDTIFDAFTQTEKSYTRRYQGAGLGLSIVKRLIGLLGGGLCLTSQPQIGTQCCFSLPFRVSEGSAEVLIDDEGAVMPTPSKGMRATILLAEDDTSNRLALSRFLERAGYRVVAVCDGVEVLDELSDGNFDIILMDVQMPRLNGIVTTRMIRTDLTYARHARIPIIALTAYAMAGDKERLLKAGMDAYIAKPIIFEELVTLIERTLGSVLSA